MVAQKIRECISLLFEKKENAEEINFSEANKFFKHRTSQYKQLVQAISPYMKKDGTFIDVGACIGYFSLRLMKEVDFKGTAYLFEPIPNLAKLCQETFKNTPFKVEIFNFGLGEKECENNILIDLDGNIGWNTLEKEKKTNNMKEVKVQIKTYDSLSLDIEPSIIKIDVEGSEYKVLEGMKESFNKWKNMPVILCEVGWGKTHPNWNKELTTFENLKKKGYETFDIMGKSLDITNLSQTTDVIFIPKKQTDKT